MSSEPTSVERDAHYRMRFARQHLNRKAMETDIENDLRDLAAHCRSVAFLETEPARRDELAAAADDFERLIDTFGVVSGRVWAVMRPDWAPDRTETEGGA